MHQHGGNYFAHRPSPQTLVCGQKVKIKLFSEHGHVVGMMNAAPCKHIFCIVAQEVR